MQTVQILDEDFSDIVLDPDEFSEDIVNRIGHIAPEMLEKVCNELNKKDENQN